MQVMAEWGWFRRRAPELTLTVASPRAESVSYVGKLRHQGPRALNFKLEGGRVGAPDLQDASAIIRVSEPQRGYKNIMRIHWSSDGLSWVLAECGAAGMMTDEHNSRYIGVLDIKENRSPNAIFFRIVGDSMSGVLEDGYGVRVDKSLTEPDDGDAVAVYIEGEGCLVGYWRGGERPLLEKANRAYEAVDLNGRGRPWRIAGTVTHIVDAPIHRKQ